MSSLPLPDYNGLDAAQKLELIALLWDSLTENAESFPIPEWHREELRRRLLAAEASPELGIPWEEVKAQLRLP